MEVYLPLHELFQLIQLLAGDVGWPGGKKMVDAVILTVSVSS